MSDRIKTGTAEENGVPFNQYELLAIIRGDLRH
jgi:hypothetical protein